jgi:hypothetical protein
MQRLATDVDEQDPALRAADRLVFSALRSTANLGLRAQLLSNSSSSFGERGTNEEELIPTNRRPARRLSRPEQALASYGLVEESLDEDDPLLDN